ncbi:MAG: bifunctional indole-3-glycerol-phosphate synthase TrpC/phosphoribosylanthranilate isomerase TrpF [Deltaproteobacteria bacterium]|nr:MAG: bifunctional indole-3-glycerol-phosphate synthase TrpC/phosphoribosylanthranilate isomerase TrpF [Deltaproteobacteria bacterium]
MALEEILAHKRREVDERKARTPLEALLARAAPSDRSLEAVLRRRRTGFICECKKASPSRGLIRPDFDLEAIARAYAPFADAVSVLTDEQYFQGHPGFIQRVRRIVPGPVLWKDFVLEPWQVAEARTHGADAVLLMLSVLDDEGWRACKAMADRLEVDTLTEVHSPEEARRAAALGAPVVGVNNRDLRTLRIDLDTTARLLPLIPEDRVVVCESGIESHADVQCYRDRVDAFLVGTSLMREPSVERAIRRLVFGPVKVCGLTRHQGAERVWSAGATMGGLIFAPESPRAVSLAQAPKIQAGAPRLRWVGVFVNHDPAAIGRAAAQLRLHAVQLHGEESAADIAAVRAAVPESTEVWKAVRVRDHIPEPDAFGADRLVLDTWREGVRGGTGETFDWGLLDSVPDRSRLILSGGLRPDNAEAADALGCHALDVNSGVESHPGLKSPDLLGDFFTRLRGPGRAAVPPENAT